MNLQELVEKSGMIGTIIEGSSWKLDEAIDAVIASEDWDLAARLVVSGAEISARQMAKKLLERDAYEPLAVAACFRRQPRRPGEGASRGGGIGRKVFRDLDAEDDAKGVPDYIRDDIEEMAKSAQHARAGAMTRDAMMDRDPIRQYIVDKIAARTPTSEGAMNALVAIARASAWEETRRTAALKLANDPISVGRICRQLRIDDVVAVVDAALIGAVGESFAKELGKQFQDLVDRKDERALRFLAEHHPDEKFRESAGQWADEVGNGSGGDE